MFVGRTRELGELELAYQKPSFQFAVIYGRRRVGKTKIIQEFAKGKSVVFFTAIESNSSRNLSLLSAAIWKILMPGASKMPPFGSFEDAFERLFELAKQQKLVFVIDEYPYLASADREISSLLQNYIDNYFSGTDMMLILCGSSMSFMENQVLGYQSPLYGRRTLQFKIHPFDYRESACFVPNYTDEEKALVYGITGGIPKYLELIDDTLTLKENIIDLFLKPNGYLHEEPYNLLQQELREPANYNAVIEAIATGASRMNELATKTHMDTAHLSIYIKVLISLGIVKKESAVTEENNRRKTLYSLSDHMFCFWYRYIPDNMFMIESGDYEALYDTVIGPTLSDFMGHIYEEMCRQYVGHLNLKNELPFKIQRLGRWWGNDPNRRCEAEIDLVGINENEKKLLLGECKFRNTPVGTDVWTSLREKAAIFRQYQNPYFMLFSKSGFRDDLINAPTQEHDLMTVTLGDMYL